MLIYSKFKKKTLIAGYFRPSKKRYSRIDLCPNNEFLQVGIVNLKNRKELKPHRHLKINRKISITQEAWVIIKGSICTQREPIL